jgi:hypothetical protein
MLIELGADVDKTLHEAHIKNIVKKIALYKMIRYKFMKSDINKEEKTQIYMFRYFFNTYGHILFTTVAIAFIVKSIRLSLSLILLWRV